MTSRGGHSGAPAGVSRAEAALLIEDGLGLARRVVAGEFSATALLEASLARIARLDGVIGAVCWLAEAPARAAASAIDAELASLAGDVRAGERLLAQRPFLGVPLLLKDLGTAARDLPSRMGSRLYGEATGGPVQWAVDSTLVARYRAAGCVPFGRSTTPELGISASTEAVAYGRPTVNPHDRSRSAGGSSGGAGAATASRMVALAHGSDGAGSIRIPASCCGLVGYKPSRALMPTGPLFGEAWGGMATEHALTHSVRDSAMMLAVSAGDDLGATYGSPGFDRAALRRMALEPAAVPGASRRLTIGVVRGGSGFADAVVHPQIVAGLDRVADALHAAGHRVERFDWPMPAHEIVSAVIRTMAVWSAASIDRFCRGHGLDPAALPDGWLEPSTIGAWRLGRATSSGGYVDLLGEVNRLARLVAVRTADFDVVLMPTLAEPPATLGRFRMNNPDYVDYRLGEHGLIHYSPFTPLANLTGQPAVSLPLAQADGLPAGLQLVGRVGDDAGLFALAFELEARMPWNTRCPTDLIPATP